jgi:hypothetical protein
LGLCQMLAAAGAVRGDQQRSVRLSIFEKDGNFVRAFGAKSRIEG